jgi:uncharacterized protein (DUF983 family)
MTWRSPGGIDQADDIYTYCPVCYNEMREISRKITPVFLIIFVAIAIIVVGAFIFVILNMLEMMSNLPGP